ncbi:Beta-glucosidase BoGH3B [Streptomyces sp. RB5]|uniref:beta-glucosidase n=1 Tax=Streptomyces smaragdinus TaxID=2585196 RepID=A0A7K0CIW3_9ACTN|nr:glycoside hydrolase family 3 N-terminal domain-containing protein [Streptomyces smaragdinus]MQY13283.1 Beta-glucosidase BoGH3B [Streptomyces smaragdinus]
MHGRAWAGGLLTLLALAVGCTGSTDVPPAAAAQPRRCDSPDDCLRRMTLAEKAGQMTQVGNIYLKDPDDLARHGIGAMLSAGNDGGPGGRNGGTAAEWAKAVEGFQHAALRSRLGIPLLYGVDAVHGLGNVQGTTLFPQRIGMGATRDAGLVERADRVTRDEVLGAGMRWAFSPCVCVPRDDRWGRTYEGYGETPDLVAPLGAASVRGFQGERLGPGSVLATAKHFVADGGTVPGTGNAKEGYLLDQGDAPIDDAELRAVHLPPYRAAVDAGVGSVMATYSSVRGEKVHGDRALLTGVLKGELGFGGFLVSDYAGVQQLPDGTFAAQVERAVNAGIDMIMVPENYRGAIAAITEGVESGRISRGRVDDAVRRILAVKFRMGLFEHPYGDPKLTASVGSRAHRAVAREAVRKSQVLLENDGVLPLSREGSYRIVVGGDGADDLGRQLGGWSYAWQGQTGRHTQGTTFWQALRGAVEGTDVEVSREGRGDVAIWVGGEDPYAEGRGDSADLALPADDARELRETCARAAKCVAVLYSGRPLIIGDELAETNAFVAAWLPGTEGGGLTDTLFGAGYTGRLPVTWPRAAGDEPLNDGDGKPALFPLGYGRSPY